MPANYIKITNLQNLQTTNNTKRWDGTIEYSLDLLTWAEWSGTSVLVSNDNNDLYLRGIGNTVITNGNNSNYSWSLVGSGVNDIEIIGNIENLLDYQTVASNGHPAMGDYCFTYMFYGCVSLKTAPELQALTLTVGCYKGMFEGCVSLRSCPALPATTLANYCYNNMFKGCISMANAVALSVTTLADYCYYGMFQDCISIVTPPELPAIELAEGCYNRMFSGCTSLASVPELPATTLAEYCYYYMFYDCTSLTQLPLLPATNLPNYCYEGMFSGCRRIKVSNTMSPHYPDEYRIPSVGTGTSGLHSLFNMFLNTGGSVSATPTVNTVYYLAGLAPYTPVGNVKFKYGYKSEYESLSVKESNVMYFLIDSQEVYLGSQRYAIGRISTTDIPLDDGTNRMLNQVLPKAYNKGNTTVGVLLVTQSQYEEMISQGTIDDNIAYLLYENTIEVSNIVATTANDNIVLTAEGTDLPSDGDYMWAIYFDDVLGDLSSVGPELVLNSEYTDRYNQASTVRVATSVSGYVSNYYTVKP